MQLFCQSGAKPHDVRLGAQAEVEVGHAVEDEREGSDGSHATANF